MTSFFLLHIHWHVSQHPVWALYHFSFYIIDACSFTFYAFWRESRGGYLVKNLFYLNVYTEALILVYFLTNNSSFKFILLIRKSTAEYTKLVLHFPKDLFCKINSEIECLYIWKSTDWFLNSTCNTGSRGLTIRFMGIFFIATTTVKFQGPTLHMWHFVCFTFLRWNKYCIALDIQVYNSATCRFQRMTCKINTCLYWNEILGGNGGGSLLKLFLF